MLLFLLACFFALVMKNKILHEKVKASNVKTKLCNKKSVIDRREYLKYMFFKKIADIVYFMCCLLVIYGDYKTFKLGTQLDTMLKYKHLKEFNCLHTKLRSDACFYVTKGCTYGIFDFQLRNRKQGCFGIGKTGNLYLKKGMEFDPKKINFILSDEIKTDSKCKCIDLKMNFTQFMDNGVFHEYLRILKFIKTNEFGSFNYKEIEYTKEKTRNYVLHKYNSKELFERNEIQYYKQNEVMEDMNDILGNYMYQFGTREDYADAIVKDVLAYLVKKRILKKEVDLQEFPDLLKLIMPFNLVNPVGKYWSRVEQKTVGFDLRKVKGSNLESLFNLSVVDKFLKNGGVYIQNEVVFYQ